MMCVRVPFSKLHEHACSFFEVVGMKYCLQTNYGYVVKFIAVLSFMCVNFLLVHGKYLYSTLALNMHLPFFLDIVCTIVYQQNMRTMSSKHCQNSAVDVIRHYPCIKCDDIMSVKCSLH